MDRPDKASNLLGIFNDAIRAGSIQRCRARIELLASAASSDPKNFANPLLRVLDYMADHDPAAAIDSTILAAREADRLSAVGGVRIQHAIHNSLADYALRAVKEQPLASLTAASFLMKHAGPWERDIQWTMAELAQSLFEKTLLLSSKATKEMVIDCMYAIESMNEEDRLYFHEQQAGFVNFTALCLNNWSHGDYEWRRDAINCIVRVLEKDSRILTEQEHLFVLQACLDALGDRETQKAFSLHGYFDLFRHLKSCGYEDRVAQAASIFADSLNDCTEHEYESAFKTIHNCFPFLAKDDPSRPALRQHAENMLKVLENHPEDRNRKEVTSPAQQIIENEMTRQYRRLNFASVSDNTEAGAAAMLAYADAFRELAFMNLSEAEMITNYAFSRIAKMGFEKEIDDLKKWFEAEKMKYEAPIQAISPETFSLRFGEPKHPFHS